MFIARNSLLAPTRLVVAPTFIAAVGEKTTTALSAMPSHQVGDYLIMVAYRDGFTTPPSLPAGWTDISSPTGDNSNSMRVGYKIAASTSEVSGTWTNATNLVCGSYRGVASIGAVAVNSGLTSSVALPNLTLQNTDGSSLVVGGLGHRSGANSLASGLSGGTAMTYRGGYEGSGTEQDMALWDTNVGVSSFTGGAISYATTSGWRTAAVELRAA